MFGAVSPGKARGDFVPASEDHSFECRALIICPESIFQATYAGRPWRLERHGNSHPTEFCGLGARVCCNAHTLFLHSMPLMVTWVFSQSIIAWQSDLATMLQLTSDRTPL